VLELCAGTLKDYCDKKYRGINMYMGPELPPDGLVLYQIANGLHYIHSRNLVHRDVKPDNILISLTTPVQMKLSDFGLVKKTSDRGSHSQSGLKGTPNWMAPEILELADESSNELPHGTIQSDTFAAGCVVFYVVTGRHPFDEPTMNVIDDPKKHPNKQISNNVLNNKPKALDIELKKSKYYTFICITIFTRSAQHFLITDLQDDVHALYELIGKMILKPLKVEEGREIRIALPDVIEQLTTKLYTSRKFKKSERSISERGSFFCRFHPTELVLACLVIDKVILLSAENSSIPFSNWKEKLPRQLETGIFGKYKKIEWNVSRVFYIYLNTLYRQT
jgi:serine/threonine protein kinase